MTRQELLAKTEQAREQILLTLDNLFTELADNASAETTTQIGKKPVQEFECFVVDSYVCDDQKCSSEKIVFELPVPGQKETVLVRYQCFECGRVYPCFAIKKQELIELRGAGLPVNYTLGKDWQELRDALDPEGAGISGGGSPPDTGVRVLVPLNQSIQASGGTGGVAPAPKKRGRPRKNPLPETPEPIREETREVSLVEAPAQQPEPEVPESQPVPSLPVFTPPEAPSPVNSPVLELVSGRAAKIVKAALSDPMELMQGLQDDLDKKTLTDQKQNAQCDIAPPAEVQKAPNVPALNAEKTLHNDASAGGAKTSEEISKLIHVEPPTVDAKIFAEEFRAQMLLWEPVRLAVEFQALTGEVFTEELPVLYMREEILKKIVYTSYGVELEQAGVS